MTAFKDLRSVVRVAEKAGWAVSVTQSGHYCFLSPDKTVSPIYVSSTPSDWRAIHKIRAQLKRNGLEL